LFTEGQARLYCYVKILRKQTVYGASKERGGKRRGRGRGGGVEGGGDEGNKLFFKASTNVS